jgi:hypothetical protein
MTAQPLKLQAKDSEDIQVISAILQDAIAPVMDMIYRPEEKDFIMVVNRFCHESKGDPMFGCRERVRCAVHVRGVTGTQMQGIDQAKRDDMLDLLAVMPEGNTLQFVFAGGSKIRLNLTNWSLILEDFGEPWPATCEPCHDKALGSGQ